VKIAEEGRSVLGVDIDQSVLRPLQDGVPAFYEEGLAELLRSKEVKSNLEFSMFGAKITECNTIIVTVGTPVKQSGEPILSNLEDCARSIGNLMRRGQLVIFRSTIPPGTMRNKLKPILEKESGLEAGHDFYLAYCPERLVEGNALREIAEITHIVSGIDEKSADLAFDFFIGLGSKCRKVSSFEIAEMAKIIDNVYRDVNIGLANELSLACQELGIDVMESIQAANTSPRTKMLIPGCGVGGSCLNKDPYMLLWHLGKSANSSGVIRSARAVNESMPGRFADLIAESVGPTDGKIVAIFGVAFKSGTSDVRNSIAPQIGRSLMKKGFNVRTYDPLVPITTSSKLMEGSEVTQDVDTAVKGVSAVIICSDHPEFKNLDLVKIKRLGAPGCLVADGRNIINPKEVRNAGLGYVAIGRF